MEWMFAHHLQWVSSACLIRQGIPSILSCSGKPLVVHCSQFVAQHNLYWMTKHTWLCMLNLLIWTIFGLHGLDIFVCNAYVLLIWWCYVVLWWTLGLLLDIHKLWKVHPWWAGYSCVVSIVLCLVLFSPGQVLYTLVCVLYTYRSRLKVLLLWCIHMCNGTEWRTSLTTFITQ